MRQHLENLLIIRPGALGDTLMLLPLLGALRDGAIVTAAVRRPGLEILRPYADKCLDVEGRGWHALFEEEPDTGEVLMERPPDKVLAFLNDPDGLVSRNLERLFPRAHARVFPGRPINGDPTHAALYLARCAAGAGLPVDPEAVFARAVKAPLITTGRCCGEPHGLVFHPGSGGRRKNLRPAFWHGLIDRIAGAGGWAGEREITVLLGPAEEELRCEFEEQALSRDIRVVSSPDMEALISLLGRASAYAGHDSGVTHLSAMLGTPTVAFFKGTDPQVWRPLGPMVQVMEVTGGEGPELQERVVKALRPYMGTARNRDIHCES